VTLPHVLVDTSQTPTSTMAISATQSSQTTITEQTTVVFVPTTQNVAEVEKERKKLLKEYSVFTVIMQLLTLG
jgi:hypothetical protein